jgi:hypothetical protein
MRLERVIWSSKDATMTSYGGGSYPGSASTWVGRTKNAMNQNEMERMNMFCAKTMGRR